MIKLVKNKDQAHEITNDKNVISIGAAQDSATEGFSPIDYITSSVAMCMALTLDAVLDRGDIEVDSYEIKTSAIKANTSPSRLEKIDVEIEFKGNVDDATKEKLVLIAKRGCTIGNTIEHGAPVNVSSN